MPRRWYSARLPALLLCSALCIPSYAQLAPGDGDGDADVDLVEIALLQQCFNGPDQPIPPDCEAVDIDGDGDADLTDAANLACLMRGPGLTPSTVEVDPPPSPTTSTTITLTGRAPGAVSVEITGGVMTVSAPVVRCAFSAEVQIEPNVTSQLYVTGILRGGVRTTSTPVTVSHDSTGPMLFIDFPADGAEVTTPTVDVAGRVSDVQSGFMGLTVTVNGIQAVVDVGIGTNGTFFAPGVPLALGANIITAVAADVSGNTTQRHITVTHVEIPADAPRMMVTSGNRQTAQIGSTLSNPIVVRVTHGDGSPFPGKLVTFDVTRSNGRLTVDGKGEGGMRLQTFADVNGDVRAFWQIGNDAGCGNNRVKVTSKDIAGTTFFCASGTPAPAGQINIGSGNNQRAEAGGPAPEPLRVWVNDACNGVSGVSVVFTVIEGGGRVNGQESVTIATSVTGHAEVTLTLGQGAGNNVVEATFADNPGGPAAFTIVGLMRNESQPTRFSGVVLDNSNRPVQGAVCTIDVGGVAPPSVLTDIDGRFFFEDISSGPGGLGIDGSMAHHIGGAEGMDIPVGSFPALHYKIVVVPNTENSLPTPVLLPPLDPRNARPYSTTEDTELTVEGMEGLKMIVTAGSMRIGGQPAPDGTILTLNQVHHDDVPMPMPDGAAPPFAWTLQPAGATFDPPITIVYPNMSSLPAGSIAFFLSFDHDTNQFEIIASGHVTDDGLCIVTDPGVGITKAGWGCNCPPYSVTGDCQGCSTGPCTQVQPSLGSALRGAMTCVCPGEDGPEDPDDEPPPKHKPRAAPPQQSCPTCPEEEGIDPVYLFSGEFYETVDDLRIKGRVMDFVWSRKYRSKRGPTTALGHGWDFSYNLFIEERGGDILLCDGNSRADTYDQQPDGTWSHDGFFRQLQRNDDGTHTLEFANKGGVGLSPVRWHADRRQDREHRRPQR